jgi:lysophospholipase L1-like esterase
MRFLHIWLTAAVVLAVFSVTSAGGPYARAAGNQSVYYLSLGDSLSQGDQPGPGGTEINTNQGYVDDIYQHYLATMPNLQLVKLGCPGETTRTMINGGYCPYSLGSQLAQADNFLASHRVALVTIDIGADNIVPCFSAFGINQSCVTRGSSVAQQQLPTILSHLRQAAGSTVPIYAMNYYDPYLYYWLLGSGGQTLARQSEQDLLSFNSMLGQVYTNAGVPVADVQATFQTTNFSIVPPSALPANVTTICTWTWMCGPGPGTPSIHANATGYSQIASTFESVIGPLAR